MCFIHKLRQSIPYQQAKIETDMGLGRWFRWQRAYEELNSVPRMHIFFKKKKGRTRGGGKKVKHGGICVHVCIVGTRETELAEPWGSLTDQPSIVSEL